MDAIVDWMTNAAEAWWIYPVVFALIIADAFTVVLPSETVVVALASLAVGSGHPSLWILVPVAAIGAIVGDSLLFAVGRRVDPTRIRLLRRRGPAQALEYARRTLETRAAVVILTARYIPFARIAANLTAGASGFAYPRFLPFSAIAGCSWALFNVGIGTVFGTWLGNQPLLAVVVSVAVAIVTGIAVDRIISVVTARRARRAEPASSPVEP